MSGQEFKGYKPTPGSELEFIFRGATEAEERYFQASGTMNDALACARTSLNDWKAELERAACNIERDLRGENAAGPQVTKVTMLPDESGAYAQREGTPASNEEKKEFLRVVEALLNLANRLTTNLAQVSTLLHDQAR